MLIAHGSHHLTAVKVPTKPRQMSEPIPLVTNPSNLPSLTINGSPTHRYRMFLQELPCAEEYGKYLKSKYNLADCWDDIDWIAFGQSMKAFNNRGSSLCKYLHGWLATNDHFQHLGTHRYPKCPFCQEEEMTTHLFLCKAPDRRSKIDKTVETFLESIRQHLFPKLVETISSCISAWRNKQTITLTTQQQQWMGSQPKLGWSQFFRGRISKHMRLAIQTHAQQQTKSKNPVQVSGKAIVALIHAAWSCGLSIWKHRNEQIHAQHQQKPSISTQQTQRQVASMYQQQWNLPQHARQSFFALPINVMQTKPREYLDRWIAQVSPILKMNEGNPSTGTNRQLTDYFSHQAQPPGNPNQTAPNPEPTPCDTSIHIYISTVPIHVGPTHKV